MLIGGRATGRSTVLESIRFVLGGAGRRRARPAAARAGRRQGLGPASKVSFLVECTLPSPRRYRIERLVGQAPSVFDADTGQLLSSSPADVLPGVVVYGQRELADVADDKDYQAQEEHLLRLNVRAVLRLTHAALPRWSSGAAARSSTSAAWPASHRVRARRPTAPARRGSPTSASPCTCSTPTGASPCSPSARASPARSSPPCAAGHPRDPRPLWLDPEAVVRIALHDLDQGRSLSVPGRQYKVIVAATRVIPPRVQRTVLRGLQGRFPGRTP